VAGPQRLRRPGWPWPKLVPYAQYLEPKHTFIIEETNGTGSRTGSTDFPSYNIQSITHEFFRRTINQKVAFPGNVIVYNLLIIATFQISKYKIHLELMCNVTI